VPDPLPLVVHERLGVWARQLRPRASAWGVRLIESRSKSDLEAALEGTVCPIAIIDLGDRPRTGLEDLESVMRLAPAALALVLDPREHSGVALLARQIGAAHVLSGETTPPVLLGLLTRWLPLARLRADADGWSNAISWSADPWTGELKPDIDLGYAP
jgi:hypothetical protein